VNGSIIIYNHTDAGEPWKKVYHK